MFGGICMKRIIGLIVALSMVVCLTTSAFAVQQQDKLTLNKGDFLGYEYYYEDDGTILIRNIQDLALYGFIANGQALNGKLTDDISFPADSTGATLFMNEYTGTLDGQGHTMNIGNSNTGGIFANMAGTVKNLRVIYNSIDLTGNEDENYVGAIANKNTGTIENCTVEGNNLTGRSGAGSIAGITEGTIRNCVSILNGVMSVTGLGEVGGIAAKTSKGAVIEKCISKGTGTLTTVTGEGIIGGIVAFNGGSATDAGATVTNCITEGSLILQGKNRDAVGGIAGYHSTFAAGLHNCLVTGHVKITGSALVHAGGIAGRVERYMPNNFYNADGGISGASQADRNGPIFGYRSTGNVTGNYYNTDKTNVDNGHGTPINNIYWLNAGDNIKLTVSDDASDGFVRADRYFYYGGKTVNYEYTGTKNSNQYALFKVNGNAVYDGSFTMPSRDSELTVELVTQKSISAANTRLSDEEFVYDGISHIPSKIISEDGVLKEGIDYTAVVTDGNGNELAECKDVGTYNITIVGKNEYKGMAVFPFKIIPIDPSLEVPSAKELTYNGDYQDLIEKGNVSGGTLFYKLEDGEWSEDVPKGKDVQNYNVYYKVVGDNNHNSIKETKIEVTIKEKQAVFVKEPVGKDLNYSGKEEPLVEAGKSDAGTVVYKLDDGEWSEEVPMAKDAGEYHIAYKIVGDNNHAGTEEKTLISKIGKVDSTVIEEPYGGSLIFNGKAQPLVVAGKAQGGKILYSLDNKNYSEAIPTATKIGAYKVYWKLAADGNHNDYVAKKPISVSIRAGGVPLYKLTPKGNKIKVSWYAADSAMGYDVYYAKCGTKIKFFKSVKANKRKVTIKGLKKKKCYKIKIKAWIKDGGKKEYIKSYPLVHTYAMTNTKRYTVPKKVVIKNTKATIAKGGTFQIKAKVIKKNKKKKLMPSKHSPKIRYLSTNPDVAVVSKSGLITSLTKGNCVVYAFAANGKYKAVNVTVN